MVDVVPSVDLLVPSGIREGFSPHGLSRIGYVNFALAKISQLLSPDTLDFDVAGSDGVGLGPPWTLCL